MTVSSWPAGLKRSRANGAAPATGGVGTAGLASAQRPVAPVVQLEGVAATAPNCGGVAIDAATTTRSTTTPAPVAVTVVA